MWIKDVCHFVRATTRVSDFLFVFFLDELKFPQVDGVKKKSDTPYFLRSQCLTPQKTLTNNRLPKLLPARRLNEHEYIRMKLGKENIYKSAGRFIVCTSGTSS